MAGPRHDELVAWGVSLAVHLVLFVVIALTGLFLLAQPQEQPPEAVAVTVMDAPAGGGGGGASAPAPAPAAPALALPENVSVPAIEESYTKEPERQQEYREEHHAPTPPAASDNQQATSGTQAAPPSAGQDTGTGTGGTGSGSGTGEGSGTGNGSGSGSGSGTGEGTGAGPAGPGSSPSDPTAATCTYRPAPSYPPSLQEAGAEGSVTVQILVAPDNSITSVDVVSSSGYREFDQAAVAAAYGCRFQMNGLYGRYTTTYVFQLQDSDDW